MDLFQVLVLSVVEGITEFLPISSTGHMVLTSSLLKIPETEFVKSFEIIIQSGAIAAVIFLFGLKLLKDRELLKKVIVAFVPTGILGLLLYKVIKGLIGNLEVTLASLFLGGIVLIVIELYLKGKDSPKKKDINFKDLTYKNAFLIGVGQSLSMVPGVSRAAATIISGLLVGLNRTQAVEFSFILAIPTMLAATGLDLVKSASSFSSSQVSDLAVGFVVSFIVAILVIKWLLNFVRKSTFIPFGIYRIILAIAFYLIVVRA